MSTYKARLSGVRLNETDLALLRQITRWRYMTASQMLVSGPVEGVSQSNVYRRLARLESIGLLTRQRPAATHALWIPTAEAYDLVESSLHPEQDVMLGSLLHTLAVADVGLRYEAAGMTVRSEREVAQALQAWRKPGKRALEYGVTPEYLWVTLPTRKAEEHAPDLVLVMRTADSVKVWLAAVEIELSSKPIDRIKDVLRGYVGAHQRFIEVVYWVKSQAVADKIDRIAAQVLAEFNEKPHIKVTAKVYQPWHSPTRAKRAEEIEAARQKAAKKAAQR